MGKVFLADIPTEYGVKGLIADGHMLKFHFNGTCLGDFPISYGVTTMQEVDIVSVLNVEGKIELAFNISHEFSKTETSKPMSELTNKLGSINGLVFVGMKMESIDNVKYVQYIYAFLKGTIHKDLVV